MLRACVWCMLVCYVSVAYCQFGTLYISGSIITKCFLVLLLHHNISNFGSLPYFFSCRNSQADTKTANERSLVDVNRSFCSSSTVYLLSLIFACHCKTKTGSSTRNKSSYHNSSCVPNLKWIDCSIHLGPCLHSHSHSYFMWCDSMRPQCARNPTAERIENKFNK